MYGTGFPKSLFKIPVIRTNLNGCAELSPPPQGEARSGRVPTQNASAFCVGLGGGLGAVYISTLPRCGLCSAVIHQTAPSPAGRSPQRGRDGVGVSDIVDESKACFSRLLPSPSPLSCCASNTCRYASCPSPTGRGSISALCLDSLHYIGLEFGLFQIYSTIHTH